MTRFDEYKNRWPGNIRMERSADGVLQMDFHSDGGPLVWAGTVHTDFPDAFWEVGRDHDNQVVVLNFPFRTRQTGDAVPQRDEYGVLAHRSTASPLDRATGWNGCTWKASSFS